MRQSTYTTLARSLDVKGRGARVSGNIFLILILLSLFFWGVIIVFKVGNLEYVYILQDK